MNNNIKSAGNQEQITIATNCYELDYRMVLHPEYGNLLFHPSNKLFTNRLLMINDVEDRNNAERMAEMANSKGIISQYYFCCDVADLIMKRYECSRESFIQKYSLIRSLKYAIRNQRHFKRSFDGYNYTIPVMSAIHLCNTKWLIYCEEDVLFEDETSEEWIVKSIDMMKNDDRFFVANPLWNGELQEAISESEKEEKDFLISSGFSCQCFLINAERIKNTINIYSESNKQSDILYPIYAGNCFEKRINSYMRNHGFKRITYKNCNYSHKTITKEHIGKYIRVHNY